jgi:hypothetical protein
LPKSWSDEAKSLSNLLQVIKPVLCQLFYIIFEGTLYKAFTWCQFAKTSTSLQAQPTKAESVGGQHKSA